MGLGWLLRGTRSSTTAPACRWRCGWLPTAGAFARFVVLGLFTISVIIYALKHGAHGLGASDHKPSESGFVLLVGVLLFNYVGFELPSSAGEEMTNPQRDVPFAIARSTVFSVVLYALPVIGILIVLPAAAITNFSGFVSAIQTVFTVYGGHVSSGGAATLSGAGLVLGDGCAILFILCLITSGATWIMGSDRALAVSWDHLHHADQLPAHLPGAVEAAPQPPGHVPPL